jgi:type VI secretion system protein VasG
MLDVAPKALIAKVNPLCLKALEGAIGMCVSNTNAHVEIEHWLLKLLEPANSDISKIFKHCDVDTARVTREVQKSLEKLRRGHDRSPALSSDILDCIGQAWMMATLGFERAKIRSAFVLATLCKGRDLLNRVRDITPELGNAASKIAGLFNVSDVNLQRQAQMQINALLNGSVEDAMDEVAMAGPAGAGAAAGGPGQPIPGSKTPNLDQFCINLTAQAKKGMDPVIGRDFEIRQVIDILTRRRQNNPILTGDAGVGKTAVVEGFAMAVAKGEVPASLRNIEIRSLDLGLLQAGAGVKGEFENRLKALIQEVKSSPTPIVLFIDEAHTLIGAGGAAGQNDAANLLKPALARGEMRTIAATTRMEYKKYFETDPALKRRFQEVKVDEPDIAKAIRMMRGLADVMEGHHKVRVMDDAVAEAVKLSHRYITDRQLPDKCVSLLDTACARVALSQTSTPPQIQDCQREIELLDVELRTLEKESSMGTDHAARAADLTEKKTAIETKLAALDKRWAQEKELAGKVREIYEKLSGHFAATKGKGDGKGKLSAADEQKSKADLATLEIELSTVQGENPLVLPVVAGQAVAEVVSGWTGVPLGKMVRDEIKTVLTLKDRLKERVIGQDHGLEAIAQRIRTSRANLADPKRPLGVFLLAGPSGVGKTETAIALADILFGGDRNMVVINMSEYKEDHKISRLTGSAPGYVGYGEGGVLTEAVRRKPYSVVLLDEIEKANQSVQEIFYQVFDKGTLQDDKGNEINFKNTIIILTSNVGTETIVKVCADPDTRPDPEGLTEAMRPDLLKSFKPALLGRMAIVPYYPLNDEMLRAIITLKLKAVVNRVKENHKAAFTYDDALVTTISSRCKEVESGARNVDHIISGSILPEMAQTILSNIAEGKPFSKAHIGVDQDGKFVYTVE